MKSQRQLLRIFVSRWNKENLDVVEVKIEESERPAVAGNRTQDTWLVQPVPSAFLSAFRLRKLLSINSLLMERIFQSTHNGVLLAHTEWLPGVRLRHFSPTCTVHVEDCESCWLSGCCSSVAEHWLHKPGVLGSIPGHCRPFTFLYFCLKNI